MSPWIDIAGDAGSGLLIIGDHASARIPEGINLAISSEIMDEHVAIDIGVAPLGAALCAALGCPGVFGNVSRLVIDLNRDETDIDLIPEASDGHVIYGNVDLAMEARRERVEGLWRPYHTHISHVITEHSPKLLISLHSFTPCLRGSSVLRPWEIGILYNDDDRAARIAIPLLAAAGIVTGDNQPYSGRMLNATMNHHGEARGIAYLGIEVRQDLLTHPDQIRSWCNIITKLVSETVTSLRGD